MNNQQKWVWGIVTAIAVLGIIWWGSQVRRQAEDSIQVGAILSLTGDLSFVGTHIQRGMLMALRDNPAANIEIIFEDDESFNTTSAVNGLNKLANIDNVSVVFNEAVNTVKALAPTIRGHQIPTIVVWDNTEELAGLDDLIFGFGYSTEKTGEKAANYIFSDLGADSVTIVSAHDEWSDIISDAFSKQFSTSGGRVDLHKKVDVDEADLRTIILQARDARSQAIFFPLFQSGMVGLVKQAKELGYEGFLMTGDSLTSVEFQDFSGLFEGVYSAQPWLVDAESFSRKYRNEFSEGTDSAGLAYAGLGYDAASLLIQVIDILRQNEKLLSSENLQAGIASIEFEGVTGTTDLSKLNVSDRIESITVVKNGQFELVEL